MAYDFHRVLIWRARAAQMRDRAARAVSPSDVDDFEMLARYWDQRADEAERSELGDAANAPPDAREQHKHREHGRN